MAWITFAAAYGFILATLALSANGPRETSRERGLTHSVNLAKR